MTALTMDRLLGRAIAAGAAIVLLAEPNQPAAAASATAEIHARIISGSGVTTLSGLQIRPAIVTGSMRNLGPQGIGTGGAMRASHSVGPIFATPPAVGAPARISIAGRPYQTVAISFPTVTTLHAKPTPLSVGGFRHDGGLTPVFDANGIGIFEITGDVAAVEDLSQFEVSGRAPDDELLLVRPRLFDVLVSYN